MESYFALCSGPNEEGNVVYISPGKKMLTTLTCALVVPETGSIETEADTSEKQ